MDKRRLPATLRTNRSDIADLNERANLIKIIKNRDNAIDKRKELLGEYNEIMKRLFKAQQKKKARLRAGRGGVRTSRSWDKRNQERYKRGERREEGEDESKIIGEEIKKDALGNLQITYKDYEKEDAEKRRLETRLENIATQDRQLRRIELDENLAYKEERDRENIILQKEFRDRDDDFKEFNMAREDEGERTSRKTNRAYQKAKLELLEEKLSQGDDFFNALQSLDSKFSNMFDAATEQYKHLIMSNPQGIELQDLIDKNPRVSKQGVIQLGNKKPILELEIDEGIPIVESDEEIESNTPPIPRTPKGPRTYTADLKPIKEKRQAVGDKKTYKEDLDTIAIKYNIPPDNTPERVRFDNALVAGDKTILEEFDKTNAEILLKQQEAETLKGEIEADKKKIQLMENQMRAQQFEKDPSQLTQVKSAPIQNPVVTRIKQRERQKTIDSLPPGLAFTDIDQDLQGFFNPLNPVADIKKQQQEVDDTEGLFTIGSEKAIEAGIAQSPVIGPSNAPADPSPIDLGEGVGEIPPPQPNESAQKFIAGKYKKDQRVNYLREGKWRPAKILNYQADEAGDAQITIQKTTGKTQTPIDTIYEKIVAYPDEGEILKQMELREGLKSGVDLDAEDAFKKSGPDWEDRDKYIIKNNTDHFFRGIAPQGKSVLNYHKEHQSEWKENTYLHTPLTADMEWIGKSRSFAPKYLEPALKSGILSLEKLDEKLPFKKGPSQISKSAGPQKSALLEIDESAQEPSAEGADDE